jgi:hypothetical protein
LAAALDADELRIGERSIVGEEGIVMNIIQIHLHAARPRHGHSRHGHVGHVGSHTARARLRRVADAFATWVILDHLHHGVGCSCARAG